MNAEEKYGLFAEYLEGTLTDAQRSGLEKQLESDPALQDDFALYQEARASIAARAKWEATHPEFLKTLDALSSQHFPQRRIGKVVLLHQRKWLLRALSVAAVLLLVVFVWQPWQKDLYNRFAQHPRAELTQRDGSVLLSEGERAVNDHNYSEALDAFTTYLSTHPDDLEILFYQGICLLETDRLEDAKFNFRKLVNANAPFDDSGAWYLGLTFLKENNVDSTRWYLNQINASSEYFDNASTLLKKL